MAIDDWNNGKNKFITINLFYLISCLFLSKKDHLLFQKFVDVQKLTQNLQNRAHSFFLFFFLRCHLSNWLIVDVICHIILSPFIMTNNWMQEKFHSHVCGRKKERKMIWFKELWSSAPSLITAYRWLTLCWHYSIVWWSWHFFASIRTIERYNTSMCDSVIRLLNINILDWILFTQRHQEPVAHKHFKI